MLSKELNKVNVNKTFVVVAGRLKLLMVKSMACHVFLNFAKINPKEYYYSELTLYWLPTCNSQVLRVGI